MKRLKNTDKKIIELDEMDRILNIATYRELYITINEMVEKGEIEPVKSSGGNGKKPPLYKKYRRLEHKENKSHLIEEINYKLSTKFRVEYYKNHLKEYKEHRKWILMLNEFFINRTELLEKSVSMNERAFQIWGREKFLQKEGGKKIVKNLGLELQNLNYYDTSEPLAYYSKSKNIPQKILIIENKDTYYTMRRHLISGGEKILGEDISTLIYGGGKNISKAFRDYDISVERHVSHEENTLLYFGDLDYEGIIIYEKLKESFSEEYNIKPFTAAYEKMIDKGEEEKIQLPQTKEKQNTNIKEIFLNEFNKEYRKKIQDILKAGLYIPQEIITITDLIEDKNSDEIENRR